MGLITDNPLVTALISIHLKIGDEFLIVLEVHCSDVEILDPRKKSLSYYLIKKPSRKPDMRATGGKLCTCFAILSCEFNDIVSVLCMYKQVIGLFSEL